MKRIVITGIGVVSPAGIGKKIFWHDIMNGISHISENPTMKNMHLKSSVSASFAVLVGVYRVTY